MLFPGRKIPILVDPKQIFVVFESEKSKKKKKKKKKKGPHLFFSRFPASISNFPPFLLNFHPFSLFSLPLFSRYVSKKFPIRSLWGGTLPPLPPACYATACLRLRREDIQIGIVRPRVRLSLPLQR